PRAPPAPPRVGADPLPRRRADPAPQRSSPYAPARPAAHRPGRSPRDNEWLLPQLAAHLGCPTAALRGCLRAGHLTGRREPRAPHRWILLAPPEEVDELRDRLA